MEPELELELEMKTKSILGERSQVGGESAYFGYIIGFYRSK